MNEEWLKTNRTHEECCGCQFVNIMPAPCKGHVEGPVACGDKPKLIARLNAKPKISKPAFEGASAFDKGYLVYIFGYHENEINVPKKYDPCADELEEYNSGQQYAIINTIDSQE